VSTNLGEAHGVRLGNNRRGLRPEVLARWVLRRTAAFDAWVAAGCSYAGAARVLRCTRQTAFVLVRRYAEGLKVQTEALAELERKLKSRRARRAWLAAGRRWRAKLKRERENR